MEMLTHIFYVIAGDMIPMAKRYAGPTQRTVFFTKTLSNTLES